VSLDLCPLLPNDCQRFLQRILGILGDSRDPPDRSQHLLLDRLDESVESRSIGVQMDTSVFDLITAITGCLYHFSQVTERIERIVYKKNSPGQEFPLL
jgi:hypothetical protein